MYHPTADRLIDHPLGYLQTACTLLTRLRAAQHARTASLCCFMYEHCLAKLWMPGIKNLPFLSTVGVMLPSCTTSIAFTNRSMAILR
jgi:hypothetical protein